MDEQVQILSRVEELGKKPGNNVCADCPERHPTWVALIKSAFRGGEVMGAFVCQGCSKHHLKLGSKICEVKGISMATKWSFKELGIVSKTGNKMVNGIYECCHEDELCDDKEIITFDKEEAAKLRGDFIRNKYIKRKYFSEDQFHATMMQLNSTYKRYDEVSTRASSPRRASMMAGGPASTQEVPSTPSRQQRRSSISPNSPTDNANKHQESEMVPSTPRKSDSAIHRNLKDDAAGVSQTPRRTIPSSNLVTPRNGARRRGSLMTPSNAAADPYRRQQQSLLAAAPALDAEIMEIAMSDGSQRGEENTGVEGSRRRCRRQSMYRDDIQSLSQRSLGTMEKTPSERSLSGSQRGGGGGSSARRQRIMMNRESSDRSLTESQRGSQRGPRQSIINRESSDRSLSGSQRGPRRSIMDKTPSDRSLSSSQRGSRSRRGSLRDSERSHSARDVNRGDRNRRRQSLLLKPEESESESEAERELQPNALKDSDHAAKLLHLPAQLASVNSTLSKRTSQSMRTTRTSISLPNGAHSMRAGRTSVVLEDGEHGANKILDRRRSSMLQANQRLSRRSMMERTSSDRNFDGNGSRRISKTESMDESSQSIRDSRTMDYSSRSMRDSSGGNSRSRSQRSSRSSSKRDKKERSLSREKPRDKSSRGKRSGMKDASDRSSRSRRMKDISDPDSKSSRGSRHPASLRSSDRSRRDGSRKASTSPQRRIKKSATIDLRPCSEEHEDIKQNIKCVHRSRSVGTLGELIATVGTLGELIASGSCKEGAAAVAPEQKEAKNFDWKSHSKSMNGEEKRREKSPSRSSRKKHHSKSTSPSKRASTGGMQPPDDDEAAAINNKHKKRSSDPPLRGNSGHDRKKKPSRVRRGNSDVGGDDSDSDHGDDRGTKSRRKADRKSMKRVPSKRSMRRSFSVGLLSETDDESRRNNHHHRGNKGGPDRRLSKGSQSARNLLSDDGGGADAEPRRSRKTKRSATQSDRRESSSANDKYKNLDSNVMSTNYSAGSLGLLMGITPTENGKDTTTSKEKNGGSRAGAGGGGGLTAASLSASGTLSFLAQHTSASSKMSDVFGAGRASIVTQWMSPAEVASTAAAAAAAKAAAMANNRKAAPPSPEKKPDNNAATSEDAENDGGKKRSVPEINHNLKSYNDAVVAQWLAA